jgi:two-component system sensor histidine kinase ChvG
MSVRLDRAARTRLDEGSARALPRRARRRGPFSALTRRILAINILALAIVVAGLLYLGAYRDELIEARATALRTQGEIIAVALGASVVTGPVEGARYIEPEPARQMLRRLVVPIRTRARLFDTTGALIADTRRLPGVGPSIQVQDLPPPPSALETVLNDSYAWISGLVVLRDEIEPYREGIIQRAEDYAEVLSALAGENDSALRDVGDGRLILSVAVPVQRFKHVKGALFLSASIVAVEESVREVRTAIFQIFGIGLSVTISLSIFLAGTIARPIRRLADAADEVRFGRAHATAIPDFSSRDDEIGDLSLALNHMTSALSERLEAIERFAADVAHEIKNPLSSLRSAVETVTRIEDPEQQRILLAIVKDDVQRLDRLISDISDASRLDAELARAETSAVDIGRMLATLAEVDRTTGEADDQAPRLDVVMRPGAVLVVPGVEDRLVQVFQNLINNARSFSPPGGRIRLFARHEPDAVVVSVEDSGPGIPASALEAIFDRFYSERPSDEKFGTHSGLGLAISRQIVEAHGGVIYAENRSGNGGSAGARFVVRLPV